MEEKKQLGIGKRIKEARLKKGLTQEELGKLIGVTGSAITNYEKETSRLREPIIYALMQVLEVDANYLFQDSITLPKKITSSLSDEDIKIAYKYSQLDKWGKQTVRSVINDEQTRCQEQIKNTKPKLNEIDNIMYLPEPIQSASAGYGQLADDDTAETVAVIRNNVTAKADYIMRVSGDSMEPKFFDSQRVLIRQQPAVEIGEFGIFIIGGERFIKTYRGDHLESANPNYPDVQFDEYSRCIGKVLGVLQDEWIVEE